MRNSVALAMLALFGAVHGYPKGYKNCTESIVTVTKTGEPPSDSCGQGYGPGCYDSCKTPSPTYTTPGCSLSTPTGTDLPSTCTRTLCVDYIDDCGGMYGTCYNDCLPEPPLTKPPCTPSSTPVTSPDTSTPTPTETCTLTVCIDGVTPCGEGFGGCFPACDGIPTDEISTPPCSITDYTPPPATTYYR